jgi:hypothetical protein
MNPSLRTLGQLRRGQFVTDLDAELAALVDAVRDTGRKGRLTIALEIQPAGKGDNITLRVTDSINCKPPQPETGDTLMFATADGQLSRQDPRQIEMEGIREVRKPQKGETA